LPKDTANKKQKDLNNLTILIISPIFDPR